MKRPGFTQMAFQIRQETAADFKAACEGVGTSATTMVLAFMFMLSSKAKAGRLRLPVRLADDDDIPLKNLQVVLDRAESLTEVRDLVHTVLRDGPPLNWNSHIGPGADWSNELREAIDARLSDLRRAHDGTTAGAEKRGRHARRAAKK